MPPAETRTTYHHGSLRQELISACVHLIETEGIGAVSLRAVARAAGVSPGAPYHHFPDRSALLAAIEVEGYQRMTAALREARAAAPTALRALTAMLQAFVLFGRDHPAYLHLMLRPELSKPEKNHEAAQAGEAAIALLTDVVQACQREGTAPPGPTDPLVALVWALATGIVTLWIDGPLESRCVDIGTTPEALTAQVAALLETLLATTSRPAG